KRFARDVPTRWNSTYKLLLSTFEYKELLCGFFGQVVQSSSLYLFSNQWNICTTICEILKVFSDATDQLSGVYYPTCHLVVTHICNGACIFCEHLNSNEPPLIECIISMKTKWEKYFLNIPEIFLCAIILDPRLKLDCLGELLTLYYDYLNPITDTCPSSSIILSSVRNSLTEIYTEYNEKYGSQVATQTQHTTSSIITSRLTKAQNLIRDRTKRPRGSSSSNLELENYLTTTFDFSTTDDEDTFDILRWWAQKKQVYPILSLMAKVILACPVSTVAVEQAFSMGGNTLDERRSTIRPENLEAQCLLNDWSRAASRTQDQDETNDDENTEGTSGTTTGGGGTNECD
ncbi:zinc finger BED domain-containing protein RICESLEEPER 2-like, partial [Dorcoceras hygrometricum]